jgi:hypothetical protein
MLKKTLPKKAPLYLNTPNQNIPKPTILKPTMPAQHPRNEPAPATAMAAPAARTP